VDGGGVEKSRISSLWRVFGPGILQSCRLPLHLRDVLLQTKRRGRPQGIKASREDLDILWQVYVWMTWPQNRTKSFDQLVRWADIHRPARAADRTTLPNRLKRLHRAIVADPAHFGFPQWVAELPFTLRRVTQPKLSGAQRRRMRRAVCSLNAEAARALEDLKSQTRPLKG
jgi:hypothetical protein